MKKFKQIVAQIQLSKADPAAELTPLLWQYICYSPKMPLRLQQQQLLDESEVFTLSVQDEYFGQGELNFNAFRWGNGKHRILLTHGWGSKAGDLSDIITALRLMGDVEVISFDAPGNGGSEGHLSSLLLYVLAVKAVVSHFGTPAILFGHSLGAMANIIAMKELDILPSLLISLTPLVRLKENFESSMDAAAIDAHSQAKFLSSFEDKFGVPASNYTLNNYYTFDAPPNHWLVHDETDQISPYNYLQEFIHMYPSVRASNYAGEGHYKILKSPAFITDLIANISGIFSTQIPLLPAV